MGASVMLGRDLDVLPSDIAASVFIFDADVGEMNLIVEVRQLVLTSPLLNLFETPIRSAVAIAIAAIAFLEKALILAFQLPIELHAQNSGIAVLQPLRCLQVGAIELRVVGSLARLVGARIEGLAAV